MDNIDTLADLALNAIFETPEYMELVLVYYNKRVLKLNQEPILDDTRFDDPLYWMIANEFLMSLLAKMTHMSATIVT